MQLKIGIWAWIISPSKHVRMAIKNCKDYVSKHLPLYNIQNQSWLPICSWQSLNWVLMLVQNSTPSCHCISSPRLELFAGWLNQATLTQQWKSHCSCCTQHFYMKVTWMPCCISWLNLVCITIHISAWTQPFQTLTQLWIVISSMAMSQNPFHQMLLSPCANKQIYTCLVWIQQPCRGQTDQTFMQQLQPVDCHLNLLSYN